MTNPRDVKYATEQIAEWLGEIKDRAMLATHNQSFAILRAVLLELRDSQELDAIAQTGNALPALPRGIYYQDFAPFELARPVPDAQSFAERVAERLSPHVIGPTTTVSDVFATLKHRLDPHEAGIVRAHLPEALQPVWDEADPTAPTERTYGTAGLIDL